MKTGPIAGTMLVIALQVTTFIGLWTFMVGIARFYNRFPPELFFDITIYYGAIGIISLFLVCGTGALLSRNPFVKWGMIIIGLLVWLLWLWPSFDSRPFALPSFFILGAAILVLGAGFGVPLIQRLAAGKNYSDPAKPPRD